MIDSNSHRLLRRQYNRVFSDGVFDEKKLPELFQLINDSYTNFDEDRALNRRAEEISSRELELINAQLEEKNTFLDSFNHGLAHDVKNHTANFKGLMSMLNKYLARKNEKMVKTIVGKLENSISQMINILDGFLYLSRAEGKFDDQFALINGEKLKEQIQLEIEYLTSSNNIEVAYNFNPQNLSYSRHILRIIFVNLISNSIKFRRDNVEAKIVASLDYIDDLIILTVRDNGKGMDLESDEQKIFKLFNRFEQNPGVKGYGVGLFMIKKVLDYNHGKFEILSKINEGTEIKISLPTHIKK